jgi:hypothetical protein
MLRNRNIERRLMPCGGDINPAANQLHMFNIDKMESRSIKSAQ